jgi:methyltransferase (TIGR00027 family)
MQLRTRAIDDALEEFVRAGGAQVVLLGAGYDSRAWRLPFLDGKTLFEVDHPATQGDKQRRLAAQGAPLERARFLAWNFERQPLAELPAALAALGLDRARPTATVWEGVTPYLTREAIDGTLAAVHAWSAPGSRLILTYLHRAALERPTVVMRMRRQIIGRAGEPFRSGFDPGEPLRAFLATRGFTLLADRTMAELAGALVPGSRVGRLANRMQSVAVASVW